MESRLYQVHYQFWFDKNNKKDFKINIDPKTIVMVTPELGEKPAWAKLEYKQCTCCPLNKEEQPYCPIAINIAKIVETFMDKISYERCVVKCVTPERAYQKKTSLMEGLSSVLGLIMATSNCPHMSIFKPMARFHLPFSTIEETIVRSTSMYLLRQYFVYKNDEIPDLDLTKLYKQYETVKILNAGLLKRLKGLHLEDSDRNAIMMFHSISELLSAEIDTNLSSIKYLLE